MGAILENYLIFLDFKGKVFKLLRFILYENETEYSVYFEADALRAYTVHYTRGVLQLFENRLSELKLAVLVQSFLIKFSFSTFQIKLILL